MKSMETLKPNIWYPIPKNNVSMYPSPQSILRLAVGTGEYKFVSQTITSDHIRAACVMPLDVPFQHLMDEPWAMSYKNDSWRMIIVSTLKPTTWLEIARASGAISWYKGHPNTITFDWEESKPVLDRHGLMVRPPNALGANGKENKIPSVGKQQKDYNREDVIDDLREGLLSQTAIGEKHGISRITVIKIGKQEGIITRRPSSVQTYS